MTGLIRMTAVPLPVMTTISLTLMTAVPLSSVPRPFQIVQRLFVGIVPIRQFPFVQIIRRIRVAEFGVLFHILFRLIVRG